MDGVVPGGDGEEEKQKSKFILYKKRWVMLFLFSILSMGNAITWISFASISDKCRDYWGVSSLAINLLSMFFMILYLPGSAMGGYLLDIYGAKTGLLAGACVTILGSWIRVGGNHPKGYPVALVGQLLCALAQPFILNAPPVVSAHWFGDKERAVGTTIGTVANALGVGIGFLIPPAIVSTKEDIPMMLLVEALLVTGMCLPIIFYKNDPKTPPSASAGSTGGIQMDYRHQVPLLLKDKNFWVLLLSFGLGLGCFNALATIVNQMVEPFGFDNDFAGTLGALVIFVGLVGAGIAGAYVDITKKYKRILVLSYLGGSVSMVICLAVIRVNAHAGVAISLSLFGFFLTPVLAVSFEAAAEQVYPMGEATPSGLLMSLGQIVGVILILSMDALIIAYGKAGSRGVIGLTAGCILVAGLIQTRYREVLLRTKAESEAAKLDEEEESSGTPEDEEEGKDKVAENATE